MSIVLTRRPVVGVATKDQAKGLRSQLRAAAGRQVSEVRVTTTYYADDTGTPTRICHLAMILDRRGREVPLKREEAISIITALRDVFPGADWSQALDYDTADGVLTLHVVRIPAYLRDEHGSRRTYLNGCRCDECRAANTTHCREHQRQRVGDPAAANQAGHGKDSTYSNYGCRCEPCKQAHSVQMAKRSRGAR